MVLVAENRSDLGHGQAGADELPNTDKPIAVVDEAATRSRIELHETKQSVEIFHRLDWQSGVRECLKGFRAIQNNGIIKRTSGSRAQARV